MLLQKGSAGPLVSAVQQSLIECNYTVSQVELAASLFSDSTDQAIRAFQASHIGQGGKPLSEDGVVGPETLWALQHPGAPNQSYLADGWRCDISSARPEVRRVLEFAVGEIGVKEIPDGSNDGPRIRTYTAPDFIGSPWCALFTSWCFEHGCDEGSPFGRIASTWGIYTWAKMHNRVLATADVILPGDVFVILRGQATDPNRRGHTGIVSADLGNGNFATLAGNESNSVRGAVRTRSGVSAVLRPVPLLLTS